VIAATHPRRRPQGRRPAAALCCILAALLISIALPAEAAADPVAPAEPTAPSAGAPPTPSGGASASAFDSQGMWIWYVTRSNGGDVPAIVARAKRSRIGTVYVKAGDGPTAWSQFTSSLVAALHAGGLKVCAWQFVYGKAPYKEANVGAAAVAKGADCLVIDAEGQYEGKYAAADQYINKLRAQVGPAFPVSLAAFPYVDYHPGFPYSVFIAPGAAQFNQPQMYWKAIGTTVGRVYAHTYLFNRVFGRPIYPIGQTYEDPGERTIKRFRRYAINYGAGGVSWWSWQETGGREWGVLGRRVRKMRGVRPSTELPLLRKGSRGDLVVWAQEHLVAAGQPSLPVTGIYAGKTAAAVASFQSQNGLLADGMLGTDTWRKLLGYTPIKVPWGTASRRARAASAAPGGATAPLSASLPPRRNEIDPRPGR
jgi:Putative peptidoglycan binding domain